MPNKSISELFNLSGKTAVVTGGAMGIGYGIVKRLYEAGANVVIADIDKKTGEEKAKSLGGKENRAVFIKTDVSSEKDVKNLINKTIKEFGGLNIFVNDAGIFPNKPVLDMDLGLWEKIQAINLRGVFLCCREAGKVMVKNGGGNIINIASIDALHPSQIGLASYDASKHGVWGFTKNFALEVAKQGVRVNAIAPGGINTEGVQKMNSGGAGDGQEEMIKQFTQKIPLGRFGEPDEIALAVLFLASEASSYMTGAMIVVDGGFLLT
ncbi:MAG: SDR family NAD(P)-dependent oxidoreductase [Patescibacteria group bacterium]|nr:SDR family NAD(P)-dependent oxidoreductase [Patescibacteria group bacterium]MDD5295188.1 SDR family NAD(P)-dependent oxidoreductase [Patescibacteria group bacterium]MDD5554061.1 SDR family NAD(P)-dependent oxidoreductase [Patescibacteria group bacterium]